MNTSALCIIALTAMVASPTAQAADTTLTLACKGTTTITGMEPEPISMGLIVNFTAGTVQGFGSPSIMNYPVKIKGINDVTIDFAGFQEFFAGTQEASIRGSIDRVTGDVEATSTVMATKTKKTIISTSYSLKCRPTQRMF